MMFLLIKLMFTLLLSFTQDNSMNDISYEIIVYQNNKTIINSYYNKDSNLIKSVYYNNGITEDIFTFVYDNKLFKDIRVNSSENSIKEFWKNYYSNLFYNINYLQSLSIIVPLPILNSNEVLNVSTIMSIVNNYCVEIDNEQKVMNVMNVNQKIRFYPSNIPFIPDNFLLKDYRIRLDNNLIQCEEYFFEQGKFERNYLYLDDHLIEINSKAYFENDTTEYLTKKTFKYISK